MGELYSICIISQHFLFVLFLRWDNGAYLLMAFFQMLYLYSSLGQGEVWNP